MPCNLTARSQAIVSNATLVKMLQQEIVAQALTTYLKAKNIAVDSVHRFGPEETQFWCGDLGIVVTTHFGKLEVFAGANRWARGPVAQILQSVNAQELANEITALLTRAAGLLFQQVAKSKLAKLGAIEETSTAPNGALVIKMEI